MDDALFLAREKLNSITPLKRDCGRVCGARCCRSCDGEETGMLLFPGEEALYREKAGWEIRDTASGLMVICPGTCAREERPLSCRLFPLLPVVRDGQVRAAVDRRAGAVCPLARQGIRAMDPAFTDAVREVGEILAADDGQRRFLETLAEEQDDFETGFIAINGSNLCAVLKGASGKNGKYCNDYVADAVKLVSELGGEN